MTTHYQKIQALGNRMAENLTIMGVPSQFDEGGLTLADKILEISGRVTSGILLYADKKIAQSGDEIKFTAVYIEDGKTVSGKEVIFHGADATAISKSIPDHVDTPVGVKYAINSIPTVNAYLDKDHSIILYRKEPGYVLVYKGTQYRGTNFIMDNGIVKYTDLNNTPQTIDVSDCDTSVVYTTGTGFTITEYSIIITDDYGVATATYTCNGSGLKEVYATSGTFVSEIFVVYDCTFADNGTTEHDSTKYTINASLSETLVTDGVNVSKTASGSTAGNYTCNTALNGDFTALFEIKSTGQGVRVGIMDSNNQRAYGTFNQSEFTQVKIVKTNTTLTVQQYINNEWVDLSITGLASVDLTGTTYFNLYIYNTTTDTDFTFKNLKIYPI